MQVIQQLCTTVESSDDHATLRRGCHGLSFDIVYTLTGEEPRLTRTRGGKDVCGDTYPQRVQKLFDWEDGIPRTFCDHCFYRQLARSFHTSISETICVADADNWKASLGQCALPYFWVIPHYDKHCLFARHKKASGCTTSRPFISGLFQWSLDSIGVDLCERNRWLFGGDVHLVGRPTSVADHENTQCEQVVVSNDDIASYAIDFGSAVPFTEIPPIIEEGIEACTQRFCRRDRRISAHYEHAHECVRQWLQNPLCDLLLMIVLTQSSSTVTPVLTADVPLREPTFEAGDRKDTIHFAVTLTIRMLWILEPRWFSWAADQDDMLPVPEMAKRIGKCVYRFVFHVVCYFYLEHKGVRNLTLCKLVWALNKSNRINPQFEDLDLQDENVLLRRRNDLSFCETMDHRVEAILRCVAWY